MVESLFSIFRRAFFFIRFNLAGFLIICITSLLRSFSSLRRALSSRRFFLSMFSSFLSSLIDFESSLMCVNSCRNFSFFSKVRRCIDFLMVENLRINVHLINWLNGRFDSTSNLDRNIPLLDIFPWPARFRNAPENFRFADKFRQTCCFRYRLFCNCILWLYRLQYIYHQFSRLLFLRWWRQCFDFFHSFFLCVLCWWVMDNLRQFATSCLHIWWY